MRLANRLQDLGFGVERKRDDFEIAGILLDVPRRFSQRTACSSRRLPRSEHHRSGPEGRAGGRNSRKQKCQDDL